ncbi:G-protein coupled receptor GRL101-like, partial [Patiria miniata]|uniref:G-protein coupled receptors family 1 profile domain-containing protein n=1 Tax=Patiria miniata TaxID=46514 RepID=A0A913ZQA0_PATMI
LEHRVLTRNVEFVDPLLVENGAFSALPQDVKTVVDDYRLCCNFLGDIPGYKIANCETTQSQPPLNLCGSLMQNYGLRICMWVLGMSALLGNFGIIVWRFWHAEGSDVMRVHSFMVHNLAVSDFLMGVYMLIIAAADIHYGDRYSYKSREWRSSAPCKAAGILSVLSSEASVFFVTLISIECFLNLVFPFSRFKLRPSSARIVVLAAWVVAVCLGVVPTLVVDLDSDVYGLSDVCIGLPLTTKAYGVQLQPSDIDNPFGGADTLQIVSSTSQKPAWILSIVLFLGVNSGCFLVVLACYISIFVKVKLSARRVGTAAHRERDVILAVKMALIVGTDFACWMPVIILGILSQTGAVQVGVEVYSWIVVLVLPINSSLNPYLYTIYSAITERRQNTKQSSQKPLTNSKAKSKSIETVNSFLSDKNSN